MKKLLYITIILISGLVIAGCSLKNNAARSERPAEPIQSETALVTPSAAAEIDDLTDEEVDQVVETELQKDLDQELGAIDEDLRQMDEELKEF